MTSCLESVASSLLIKAYVDEVEGTWMNSGFIISYSTTSGRSIGSLLVTITLILVGVDYALPLLYGFISIVFAIVIIISYIFRRELRVKSIAKLKSS